MSRLRLVLLIVGILVLDLAAYLFLWPVSIDPASWTPPTAPSMSRGVFARNDALAGVERIDIGGRGPEDVALDSAGRIYGGLKDGRIMRTDADGKNPTLFANTGGRPLGLDFDAKGNLIVADADRGLLSIAPSGRLDVLSTECDGTPLVFTDDVEVGSDGRYYFSDASSKWDKDHVREDFFEHRPLGRLLVFDPSSRETRMLLGDLYFANGIAVSADASFVLVNETSKYRVKRLWLRGERSGQSEIFIENLPGFPDGISRGPGGTFWLAIYAPRSSSLDGMLDKPWLRKLVYRLPRFLQPDPVRYGMVLGIDSNGNVISNLQDPSSNSYSPITSAQMEGDWLYLGSLSYPGVARLPRTTALKSSE